MTSVLGCFVTVLVALAPAPHGGAPAVPTPTTPLAEVRPMEVRIRKLFLVRPDLLRYPVPYDTVC